MKLTWFGGTTIRIHIGGQILVVDPASAPVGIDAAELVSGADQVMAGFGGDLLAVDGAAWKPRKAQRVLDEGDGLPTVQCWSLGNGSFVVDAMGEAPLLLVQSNVPVLGRWADGAVVVLFGAAQELADRGRSLFKQWAPRLLVLASDEAAIDATFAALRDVLDGTGMVALESGLAVEV